MTIHTTQTTHNWCENIREWEVDKSFLICDQKEYINGAYTGVLIVPKHVIKYISS